MPFYNLTDAQLGELADKYPNMCCTMAPLQMFENRREVMIKLNPAWVCQQFPNYMNKEHPKLMLKYAPDWVIKHNAELAEGHAPRPNGVKITQKEWLQWLKKQYSKME